MNQLHADSVQGKNYIKLKSDHFKTDLKTSEIDKQKDQPIEVGSEIIEAILEI